VVAGRDTRATWESLAECFAQVAQVLPRGTLEAAIKRDIVEAIRLGRLPARVGRLILYSLRGQQISVQQGVPIPGEFLIIGAPGGAASFPIDWLRSRAVRKAGHGWPRVELEGIEVNAQRRALLWPRPLPMDAATSKVPDVAPRRPRGYQADRVMLAIDQLEKDGLKLSNYTEAELQLIVLKQIPRGRSGLGEPSRQVRARVIRFRLELAVRSQRQAVAK
jgi:hypothetical protein